MCLNETYSEVRIGKYWSDKFFYSEWAETRNCCIAIAFQFSLEYAIKKVKENQVSFELNGTHQLLVYADYVNLLGDIENNKKRIQKHS
jgi:hypothetical protein